MEGFDISWIGAIVGIIIAVVLIMKKMNPLYALTLGAIIGAILGGANLNQTVDILINGSQSVMSTIIRVLAAGIFAGIMMESGAAISIANTIVSKLGVKYSIVALAMATMIITAVGVFIPVAVLIVSSIALEVGKETNISKLSLLLAMSGGGKAGNIISPNPNTIAAAGGFDVQLSSVMMYGFVPAIVGLIMTIFLATMIKSKGEFVSDNDLTTKNNTTDLPTFLRSIVTPIVALFLLMIGPIGTILHIEFLSKFSLDALYVLPIAGVVGLFAMKKSSHLVQYMTSGLNRMTPTVLVLIGAGTIGGVITASDLSIQVVDLIEKSGLSGILLAPIAGILMAAGAASTSTGVILASGSFSQAILDVGVAPLAGAVMVHTGATVIDHLPHGTYFHVTGDSMKLDIKQRLKIVGYEMLVGLAMTVVATVFYGFL